MVAQAQDVLRAAIYNRVSTAKQEDEGSSLDTQEASCRAYAADRGYVIDAAMVFRETYSGVELWDRPKLSVLRDMVRRRQLDVVIVHDIDRLSRDPIHLGVVLSEADHAGVAVEFVLTPLDNSPEGQLIQYVRGYAARIEHTKIRERSLRGKRARIEAGKLHGHAAELYGYRRDKERGVRVIHEPEAAIVRRIFREVAAGKSVRSITAALNADGVPAPSASTRIFSAEGGKTARWGKSSLARIIKHEAYKGETVAWKTRSYKAKGSRSRLTETRPESEWVRLPEGTTPAIVNAATWEAAQRVGENGATTAATTRNEARPVLLRGLVACAVCGSPMYYETEKGKYRIYRCSSRDRAMGRCEGKRVPAERLEAWAWEQLEGVLMDPAKLADALAWVKAQGPDASLKGERESVARLVAKLNKQRERLAHRLADADDVVYALLVEQIGRNAEERETAQARLADIDQRLAEHEASIARLESLEGYVSRVRANLGDLGFERKRDAVVALVERVLASGNDPAGWLVHGSIPVTAGVSATTSGRCARRPPRLRGRA